MKNILLSILLFVCCIFVSNGQQTISGNFSPAEDYKWLIAYHLIPGSQRYVADTAIKNGSFSLKIEQNAPTGIYRIVYAIPQEEFYFDIIYNGKESIVLEFTAENGARFISSKENILYNTYFNQINEIENNIISFYNSGNTNKKDFLKLMSDLKSHQENFESKSNDLLVNTFIKANAPYISEKYETVETFINRKKEHYFSEMNFGNKVLQASEYLTSKITNYVFTSLPLGINNLDDTQNAIIANVKTIQDKLHAQEKKYATSVFYTLWKMASQNNLNQVSDFIYQTSLNTLALETNNVEITNEVKVHQRLRLGEIAPNLTWIENGIEKNLNTLTGSQNYIITFWSSTCSHCLKDLPILHEALKTHPNTKVIAVGLEDDESNWLQESKKLADFTHVIALKKWESDYAKLYDIHQTPLYFILNNKKEFVAYPETNEEVLDFLTTKN